VAYWVWVEQCFGRNGFYPYPIFQQVGFEGRVGLFVGAAVVMVVNTSCLQWLYGVVNGKDVRSADRPGDIKKSK